MSGQQSSSYTSYSSVSYSSSSNIDGQVSGSRHMQTTQSDNSGTTVNTASQNYGEPVVQEQRQYDVQGREMIGGANGAGSDRRIEDVDEEAQRERDRQYEERIEDEYAKREGGA